MFFRVDSQSFVRPALQWHCSSFPSGGLHDSGFKPCPHTKSGQSSTGIATNWYFKIYIKPCWICQKCDEYIYSPIWIWLLAVADVNIEMNSCDWKRKLWIGRSMLNDSGRGWEGGIWEESIKQLGVILCMRPANERRRYSVTPSLIGWAHTHNYFWQPIKRRWDGISFSRRINNNILRQNGHNFADAIFKMHLFYHNYRILI